VHKSNADNAARLPILPVLKCEEREAEWTRCCEFAFSPTSPKTEVVVTRLLVTCKANFYC
jgi:hypothetical protein